MRHIHFFEITQSPCIVLKKAVKNTIRRYKEGFAAGFGQDLLLAYIFDYPDKIIKIPVLLQVVVYAFTQPVGTDFVVNIIVLAGYKEH